MSEQWGGPSGSPLARVNGATGHEAARIYVSKLGWVPLPIIPGTKRPYIAWPPGGGLRSLEEVDAAWAKYPDADVGLMPDESGLLVVDGDGPDGIANAQSLIGEELSLTALQATTESAEGGRHWYFEHPGGYIGPSNGALAPGVDIKASRAIVVVPPSRGRRWTNPDGERGPAPATLTKRLTISANGRGPRADIAEIGLAPVKAEDSKALLLREAAVIKVSGAEQRTRNVTLNREAFGLGPLLSAGRLDFETSWWALQNAACAAGLEESEARSSLKSALLAGISAHPPTDLSALLDSVEVFIRRFVAFPSQHEPVALALWVPHTWAIDAAQYTPYIVISSPEPESGKSRLLEELELMVPRPWRAVEPSEAVLYRRVDQFRPTLLLDECDAIFAVKDREPLRALLNEGFYRGAKVPRCVGQGTKMEVAEFAVFCPKALAGLGHPPDTIRTRQIPVSLRKKTPGEVVERFRARKLRPETEALRKQLQEWAEQHTEALTDVEPELPSELSDRQQDVWEPLLAIADAAGGNWPARARDAAKNLYKAAGPVQSVGVLLLEHIRDVFDVLEHRDAAGSEELIQALVMREDGPWGEWWERAVKDERTQGAKTKLARLLKPYGVKPKKIRVGDNTMQGYELVQFADAWRRYLATPTSTTGTPGTPQVGPTSTVPGAPAVPLPIESEDR